MLKSKLTFSCLAVNYFCRALHMRVEQNESSEPLTFAVLELHDDIDATDVEPADLAMHCVNTLTCPSDEYLDVQDCSCKCLPQNC